MEGNGSARACLGGEVNVLYLGQDQVQDRASLAAGGEGECDDRIGGGEGGRREWKRPGR